MSHVSAITLTGNKQHRQEARELVAADYSPAEQLTPSQLELLRTIPYFVVDSALKHGKDLTFEQAFVGMCYALAATNLPLRALFIDAFNEAYGQPLADPAQVSFMGTAFMQGMAMKESLAVLTAEEIAGCVAATQLDLMARLPIARIIETCGMGGDRGHAGFAGKKTINASTLSALVLASLGIPTVKHGSYGNTTKIGSTDAIEMYGIASNFASEKAALEFFETHGFCYLDAHWSKTIHDLSHLLRAETINHIIGPMTVPVSAETEICKLVGVNEKIHPITVAQSYALAAQMGILRCGGVVAVAGLSTVTVNIGDLRKVADRTILDELSPYGSVVAFSHSERVIGSKVFNLADFGIELNPGDIFLANEFDVIKQANSDALSGEDKTLAKYLAANAALGFYAYNCLSEYTEIDQIDFRESFAACYEAITSGRAMDFLDRIRDTEV